MIMFIFIMINDTRVSVAICNQIVVEVNYAHANSCIDVVYVNLLIEQGVKYIPKPNLCEQ